MVRLGPHLRPHGIPVELLLVYAIGNPNAEAMAHGSTSRYIHRFRGSSKAGRQDAAQASVISQATFRRPREWLRDPIPQPTIVEHGDGFQLSTALERDEKRVSEMQEMPESPEVEVGCRSVAAQSV
jgi:hypothetical protein